jgi:hypothetical protein
MVWRNDIGAMNRKQSFLIFAFADRCDHTECMTAEEFRNMATSLPEVVEQSHMGHPDFRVGRKIFSTLGYPDATCGMVKLTPKQQETFMAAEPDVFVPVKGGWGDRGATTVRLRSAGEESVRKALVAAWRNTAPKRLAKQLDDE